MLKPKNNIVAVLDIGSSKVVCIVANIRVDGPMEVLGIGHKQTEGIKCGHVTNAKQLVRCISSAIESAEHATSVNIENVYVCISGFNLRSHYCSVETIVNGHEISERDTKMLFNKCSDLFSNDGSHVVLHSLAMQYKLDDNDSIVDPRGMYGNVLSANFHIITASKSALTNLAHCIARCHVTVSGYIASSYAVGLACLSEDERKLGVSVMDIGGGCVTIGVFENDHLCFNATVPIGGFHITKDIASGLSAALTDAERIKVLKGVVLVTAMDRNEPIEVPCIVSDGRADVGYVTKETLAGIVRPRMEEIIELAMEKVRIADQRFSCAHRIVVTGGTSRLNGLKDLMGHLLPDIRTRMGHSSLESSIIDSSDPGLSSAIGSLILIRDSFFSDGKCANTGRSPLSIKRVMDWIKEKVDL